MHTVVVVGGSSASCLIKSLPVGIVISNLVSLIRNNSANKTEYLDIEKVGARYVGFPTHKEKRHAVV